MFANNSICMVFTYEPVCKTGGTSVDGGSSVPMLLGFGLAELGHPLLLGVVEEADRLEATNAYEQLKPAVEQLTQVGWLSSHYDILAFGTGPSVVG